VSYIVFSAAWPPDTALTMCTSLKQNEVEVIHHFLFIFYQCFIMGLVSVKLIRLGMCSVSLLYLILLQYSWQDFWLSSIRQCKLDGPTTLWHKMFCGSSILWIGNCLFFCGNYILRLEKTGFSCWELIFAIFWKSRSVRNDNIFVFYLNTCKRKTDKTTCECKTDLSVSPSLLQWINNN